MGEILRSPQVVIQITTIRQEGWVFSIGQFSRITGLTIKTIRLYHERGILLPRRVDPATGYRYFDDRNVEQARAVAYLRQLEFPLSDIKEILDRFEEDADVLAFMEKQGKAIRAKMEQLNRIALSLEEIIKTEKEARAMLDDIAFEVGEKSLTDIQVAGLRWKGRYSETGKAFRQLGKLAGRHVNGKPMNLYFDTDYREEDADIETCFPVRDMKPSGGLSVHVLPGGKCVYLVHKGPYENLGRSYAKIITYIEHRGYKPLLPSREIYLKGPGLIFRGSPKNYLTEIQIMVSVDKEDSHEKS